MLLKLHKNIFYFSQLISFFLYEFFVHNLFPKLTLEFFYYNNNLLIEKNLKNLKYFNF